VNERGPAWRPRGIAAWGLDDPPNWASPAARSDSCSTRWLQDSGWC